MTAAAVASPDASAFPIELRSECRWVTWNYVRRDGKLTKKPEQNIGDPTTWLTFQQAAEAVSLRRADGIGFVLGDGVVGVDLDGCFDPESGTFSEIATDALALGTYCELSPSGRGLHVFIRANIIVSRNIRNGDGIGREVYGARRYFTVTGDRVGEARGVAGGTEAQARFDAFIAKWFPPAGETPGLVESIPQGDTLSDDAILGLLFAAKNGAKARRLYDGDDTGYRSRSEADYAMCRLLRFFTRDADQIARIVRSSGLMRAKLAAHPTYLAQTISRAISAGGRVYCRKQDNDAEKRAKHEAKAFARAPAWWATLDISHTAFRMLVLIASYTTGNTGRGAYPKAATLAEHLGIDRSHAFRAIKELEDRRLVTRVPRYNERGRRTSNEYIVSLKRGDLGGTPYAA